jgi:hypothetical protein
MSNMNFADRYAEAGITPSAAIIEMRQASAERIGKDIAKPRVLDLVSSYYGLEGVDLTWFRDEFAQEDGSFSLINNARECAVLAGAILAGLTARGNAIAILAIIAGSIGGNRVPREAPGLVAEARAAYLQHAISNRQTGAIETKIRPVATPKLGEELQALQPDPTAIVAMLGKVRLEEQEAIKSLTNQVNNSLSPLVLQMRLMREETQILWWLFGESSRTLNKSFRSFTAPQAAILAGLELGELTRVTTLGPVAAPAMLERVIQLVPGKATGTTIANVIDGFEASDLAKLRPPAEDLLPRIYPLMTAIKKSIDIGQGSWHAAFAKATGVDAKTKMSSVELASQIYVEHLLGQLT